jgi:hypothetical protein
MDHMQSMTTMRSCSTGYCSGQTPGNDGIRSCPADAPSRSFAKGINSAGALHAVAAANSELSKAALWLLGLVSIPGGLHLVATFVLVEQMDYCLVD